ncbi:MAG: phage gp6-like head-tail connector protein [Oscillospiraceae bacterium]|nr:phage gp6-like head-tail connector protein [Oscillospiraceae bacterium]
MKDDALRELKLYMHVYHDDDDAVIKRTWGAAVEYLESAGISQDGTDLVWLATAGLTLHWYDNPGFTGTDIAMPVGVRSAINQLKLTRGGADYF